MSGAERTRKFGDVRSKLMDVDRGEDIGYIATAEDVETGSVSRTEKEPIV